MKHKLILIFGSLTILFLIWYGFTPTTSLEPSINSQVSPTQIQAPIITPRISYTPQEEIFGDNNSFKILYADYNKLYTIVILGTPYETFRSQAEQRFLTQLNISAEKACDLNVSITAPYYAHKKIIPPTTFSFCSSPSNP